MEDDQLIELTFAIGRCQLNLSQNGTFSASLCESIDLDEVSQACLERGMGYGDTPLEALLNLIATALRDYTKRTT